MTCTCGEQQEKFESEITVHFREVKDSDRRPVLIFPELMACMNCGKAEFVVPEKQLTRLAKRMLPPEVLLLDILRDKTIAQRRADDAQ